MLNDEAIQYYESRKQSAVAMSEAASQPYIREIHLELARRYDGLKIESVKHQTKVLV